MGISIEASVTLYDTSIASSMCRDAEFAAGVLNAIDAEPDRYWLDELLEHLDDDGRAFIRQIAAAIADEETAGRT